MTPPNPWALDPEPDPVDVDTPHWNEDEPPDGESSETDRSTWSERNFGKTPSEWT